MDDLLAAPGKHPTAEEIMCLLDDELSMPEVRLVEAHLCECAYCRDRYRKFADASQRFSGEDLLPSGLPAPATSKIGMFPLRSSSSFAPASMRFVPTSVAAGLALLLSMAIGWQLILAPTKVSATELIQKAHATERLLADKLANAELRRRVVVTKRVNEHLAIRAEHWDVLRNGNGQLAPDGEIGIVEQELASSIPVTACRNLLPLSVRMMECLTASNEIEATAAPTADGEAGYYAILLSSLHPFTQAAFLSTWKLRSSDWRFVEATFQFVTEEGTTEFLLKELNYEMVPAERPLTVTSNTIQREPNVEPAMPAGTFMPQLSRTLASRLEIYEALEEFGPRLEDDLRIVENEDGALRLTGFVSDSRRKHMLLLLLNGLAGLEVDVESYAEVSERLVAKDNGEEFDGKGIPGDSGRGNARGQNAGPGQSMKSGGPLVAELLNERFGKDVAGKNAALAFGVRVSELSQELLFQAKWAERVRREFSPREWQTISAAEAQRLSLLEARLLLEISRKHAALRQMVAGVLCQSGCPESANDFLEATGAIKAELATPRLADDSSPWMPHLVAELSLIKTMFVDRGYQPAVTEDVAQSNWLWENARVSSTLAIRAEKVAKASKQEAASALR